MPQTLTGTEKERKLEESGEIGTMEVPAQMWWWHRKEQPVWGFLSERPTDWWPAALEDLGYWYLLPRRKAFLPERNLATTGIGRTFGVCSEATLRSPARLWHKGPAGFALLWYWRLWRGGSGEEVGKGQLCSWFICFSQMKKPCFFLQCLSGLVELNRPGDWSWFTSQQGRNSALFQTTA